MLVYLTSVVASLMGRMNSRPRPSMSEPVAAVKPISRPEPAAQPGRRQVGGVGRSRNHQKTSSAARGSPTMQLKPRLANHFHFQWPHSYSDSTLRASTSPMHPAQSNTPMLPSCCGPIGSASPLLKPVTFREHTRILPSAPRMFLHDWSCRCYQFGAAPERCNNTRTRIMLPNALPQDTRHPRTPAHNFLETAATHSSSLPHRHSRPPLLPPLDLQRLLL